jgi:hypothetical protein
MESMKAVGSLVFEGIKQVTKDTYKAIKGAVNDLSLSPKSTTKAEITTFPPNYLFTKAIDNLKNGENISVSRNNILDHCRNPSQLNANALRGVGNALKELKNDNNPHLTTLIEEATGLDPRVKGFKGIKETIEFGLLCYNTGVMTDNEFEQMKFFAGRNMSDADIGQLMGGHLLLNKS